MEAIETVITADIFDQMVQASSDRLKMNADFINSLNVFPVPDGDTGTNMSLSLESGAKYESDDASQEVGHLASSLAKGLLMGARGNSGVILSQIFRGFSQSVEGKSELNAQDLVDAVVGGAKTAYKAVMKPTEGTILTVVRQAAKAGVEAVKTTNNISEVMQAIDKASQEALKTTTDLLPVLKEVGVVDSGGQGLVFVFDAFSDVLSGKDISEYRQHEPNVGEINEMVDAKHHQSVQGKIDPEDIEFGYCTQMMVRIGKGRQVQQEFDYDTFYNYLADLGDSLLVINDDEVVKVHVHTEHPGKVLSWGQQFGDLTKIKIDNMRWQQEEIMEQDAVPDDVEPEDAPETAVIAISSGAGISKLFNSLGVTHIISGGQTMNPSTADIATMINNSHAKQAIVLPNNKNIFLAAEQAVEVAEIPTKIIHSKTIAQGMAAMLEFNPDTTLDENFEAMEGNLDTVKSGQVTVAVRDTTLDGREIKKDEFMGLVDGKIVNTDANLMDAAVKMVELMLDDDSEIITVIYGEDATQAQADELRNAILDLDDDLEVEVHEGNQPVYPFMVSVE